MRLLLSLGGVLLILPAWADLAGSLAQLQAEAYHDRGEAARALVQIGVPAVPGLIAADADGIGRIAARQALVQIGAPATPGLIAQLANPDPHRRRIAAELLGKIGDPRATEPLLAAVKDADRTVAWGAREALGCLQPAAVPRLITALDDPDKKVRDAAAAALGHSSDPRVIAPLIAHVKEGYLYQGACFAALKQIGAPAVPALLKLLSSTDVATRLTAICLLGQIGDPRALAPLLALYRATPDPTNRNDLNNPDARQQEELRNAISRLVGEDTDIYIPLLTDADQKLQRLAMNHLQYTRDPRAVPGLLAQLDKDDDMRAYYASNALPALLHAGTPEMQQVIDLLASPNKHVRYTAIGLLGQVPDPRAVPALLGLLHDPDAEIREHALYPLARFQDPRIIDPLLDVLQHDKSSAQRRALDMLASYQDPRADAALTAALQGTNVEIKLHTATLLQQRHDPRAVPVLLAMLKDPATPRRDNVLGTMANMDDPRVYDALIAALADPDFQVRCAAVSALGARQDPRVLAPLGAVLADPNKDVRIRVVDVLEKVDDPAVTPLLLQASQDPNVQTSKRALYALSMLDDPAAVPVLQGQLLGEDGRLNEWACNRLIQFGAPPIEQLAVYAQGTKWESAYPAINQLGNIDDPRTVAPLLAVLTDPGSRYRHIAAEALGKKGATQAVAPLIALLKEKNSGYVDNPLREMGAAAVAPLCEALHDPAYPRVRIINILGTWHNFHAVAALLPLLHDLDADVRAAAVETLGNIHAQESSDNQRGFVFSNEDRQNITTALIPLLRDKDTRYVTIVALGKLCNTSAVRPLLPLLQDADAKLRAATCIALGQIGDPRAVEGLIPLLWDEEEADFRPIRVSAAHALSQMPPDPRIAEALLDLLRTEQPVPHTDSAEFEDFYAVDFAAAALQALAYTRNPQATDVLLADFLSNKPSFRVIAMNEDLCEHYAHFNAIGPAAEQLAALKDPRSVPPLMQALQSRDARMRWPAAWTLGQIGDTRAVPPLIRCLEDTDAKVREEALTALRAIGAPAALRLREALPQNRATRPALLRVLGEIKEAVLKVSIHAHVGMMAGYVSSTLSQ